MDNFVLWFKLDYRHHYSIWCGNDNVLPDRLYNKNGLVPVFNSVNALRNYADTNSLPLVDEKPILHDLDAVKIWLRMTKKKNISSELLAAWNLFGDIAAIEPNESTEFENLTQCYLSEYRKLFYGENILRKSSVHPKYRPKWSSYEADKISKVMRFGFKLLRKRFRYKNFD